MNTMICGTVGLDEGARVGTAVGLALGKRVGAVGRAVGVRDGAVRPVVGMLVDGHGLGTGVGILVGRSEGMGVGAVVGSGVGAVVGSSDGTGVGASVGEMGALVGSSVGSGTGLAVGSGVGPVLKAKHESEGKITLSGETLLLILLGTVLLTPSTVILRLIVSIHAPTLTPYVNDKPLHFSSGLSQPCFFTPFSTMWSSSSALP